MNIKNNETDFKIICIKDCYSMSNNLNIKVSKGSIFTINHSDFSYGGRDFKDRFLRIIDIKNSYIQIFEKCNFRKLDEYRDEIISLVLE